MNVAEIEANIQMDESTARKQLVDVCRLAYARGYICGAEGNFSIRLSEDRLITTPAGICKGLIDEEELLLTDFGGVPISDESGAKKLRPSTELAMHLTTYRLRPDAKAIVHAHPTVAVGFTVAGVSLSKCILPEVVCCLGDIPVAPYATPSTDEVSESIADLVRNNDAVVLDHHGAITIGKDLWDAFFKMETLEHHAQTLLVAHLLGGPNPLFSSQVKKLLDIRSVYGMSGPLPVETLTGPECSRPDSEAKL